MACRLGCIGMCSTAGDDGERDDADGQVDVEDPAPAEVLGEEAAEQRPEHAGRAEDRAEQALVLAALARRDEVADDRHRQHHQPAAAEALEGAEGDQLRACSAPCRTARSRSGRSRWRSGRASCGRTGRRACPTAGWPRSTASRYAVTTQDRWSRPPRSLTMVGSAVDDDGLVEGGEQHAESSAPIAIRTARLSCCSPGSAAARRRQWRCPGPWTALLAASPRGSDWSQFPFFPSFVRLRPAGVRHRWAVRSAARRHDVSAYSILTCAADPRGLREPRTTVGGDPVAPQLKSRKSRSARPRALRVPEDTPPASAARGPAGANGRDPRAPSREGRGQEYAV